MLKGIGASGGISIGNALVISQGEALFDVHSSLTCMDEQKRFEQAATEFAQQTERLAQSIAADAGEQQAKILQGHILILNDPFLRSQIDQHISDGLSSESAVDKACSMIADILSQSDDDLTNQRVSDINDVKNRIICILTGTHSADISNVPPDTIIVARDLTPSMTAGMDRRNIIGIVTETGSKTSHSSILARALSIPAALSIKDALSRVKTGDRVIVDGGTGHVIVNPTEAEISLYSDMLSDYSRRQSELAEYRSKPTVTSDGAKLSLLGNVGSPEEAHSIMEYGGEGAGLFRTEFLFMNSGRIPDEHEQLTAYKNAAEALQGGPLIIRTLDIGGDKDVPYLNLDKEDNPFLGFRGIRYCLGNIDIFKTQLKAIIRASHYGDVRLLIPMITNASELIDVRQLINDIFSELDGEGIEYNRDIPVGVMIETPSAAISSDILAKYADFFSIGTNDLIQYIMAVDRGNSKVEYLYSPYNIAVIRTLKFIIDSANQAGIPVEMCGECASDPLMLPLLISFGLDKFSVSPSLILQTRRNISQWTIKECDKIADNVLHMSDSGKIYDYLSGAINRKNNCDSLIASR